MNSFIGTVIKKVKNIFSDVAVESNIKIESKEIDMEEKELKSLKSVMENIVIKINKEEYIKYNETPNNYRYSRFSDFIYQTFKFSTFEDLLKERTFKVYYKNLSQERKEFIEKYIGLYEYIPSNFIRGYRSKIKKIELSQLVILLALDTVPFDIYDKINGKEYFKDSTWETRKTIRMYVSVLLRDNDAKMLDFIKKMIYDNENILSFSEDIIIGIIMSDNKEAINCLVDLLKAAKLSEGLRTSILRWIDYGSLETYKMFLQLIKDENLIRFSSVKAEFAEYTGINAYYIDSKNYELQGKYVMDCMLDNKTSEYLDSANPLKIYIALYSMATNDFDSAVKYINDNIKTAEVYKKGTMLYFLQKSSQKIDSKIIVNILDENYPENIKNMVLSFNVVFENDEDKKRYIVSTLKHITSIKKTATYTILSDEVSFKVDTDAVYNYILRLVYETDYYYEEVYSYFEKYNARIFNWGREIEDECFKKIYHPAQKKAYLRNLGYNTDSSFKIIKYLDLELTEEDYMEIAKSFKSTRSEVRVTLCELFKEAEPEIILKCATYLLKQKKSELKSGGLSILADNLDRIKDIEGFIDVKQLVSDTEVAHEYEVLKNKILGLDETSESKESEVKVKEKIVYDTPTLKYDTELVNKITKFDVKEINIIADKLYNIFSSHFGEEIEVANYDGSKTVRIVGSNMNYPETLDKQDSDSKIAFQDELFEQIKHLSYEQASLLYKYYSIMNSIENSDIPKNRIKYYIEKGYVGNILYKKALKSSWRCTTEEECKARTFSSVLNAYTSSFTNIDNDAYMLSHNELIFNWYAFTIEKFKSEIDKLPEYFYYQYGKYSKREEYTIVEIPILEFIFDSPFQKEKFFDNKYACDVYKNVYNLKAKIIVPTFKLFDLLGNGISEEFIIQELTENELSRTTELSRILSGWNKKYTQDKELFINVYNKCIDIMLEEELKRSDTETKYSGPLSRCQIFYGVETFMKALDKMKKIDFVCIYRWNSVVGIKEVFSNIVRETLPEPNLTQEQFNKLVKEYNISDKKLLEACMYNKNFIEFGANYLNIKGLHKAIYYFIAHGLSYDNDEDVKKNIRRYSEYEIEDFIDGRMDIKWFNDVQKDLSEDDYKKVYHASKFIMDTSKRKRAQYFADAVTGKLSLEEIESKINDKRNQDMLLCLGLVPLNAKNKDKEALRRYNRFQQFIRETKQFGAQRRVTETKRANIAIANLATNYGMEANSFVWVMEVLLADEIKGVFEPKIVDEIEVYLSLENVTKPEIVVHKGGKKLKSVPAKYKKDEYILHINEVKKELKNQYARARLTLEQNMVDSKEFDFEEISLIDTHPVIKEIIKDILFINDGFIGLLKGDKLVDFEGKEKMLTKKSKLRIAHVVDLYKNNWDKWQIFMMNEAIKQPFKQVFRELYTLTEEEIQNDGYTNRFAGYQISARQMYGVLCSRNWIVNEYYGFEKINHAHNLRIDLYCYANWANANDLEAETLEKVEFLDNKTNKTKDMKTLDPILFSETMRDLDLVVSVAYVGGVDPLLNHTTLEMRKRILEHNLKLFKIINYTFTDKYININGEFGNYSIHLGSGIVSMQGKGMLPVFPVHSQQRGHIFLPFVDEDPKTSEIITKVLMFAKDYEIKDPTILKHLK